MTQYVRKGYEVPVYVSYRDVNGADVVPAELVEVTEATGSTAINWILDEQQSEERQLGDPRWVWVAAVGSIGDTAKLRITASVDLADGLGPQPIVTVIDFCIAGSLQDHSESAFGAARAL